jgi:hypothetical protein
MRSNSVQIPKQRLGGHMAPATESTDFERELAALAKAAHERIRSGGNPLASLTPTEVDASRASDAPEIIGRLPRRKNERRS